MEATNISKYPGSASAKEYQDQYDSDSDFGEFNYEDDIDILGFDHEAFDKAKKSAMNDHENDSEDDCTDADTNADTDADHGADRDADRDADHDADMPSIPESSSQASRRCAVLDIYNGKISRCTNVEKLKSIKNLYGVWEIDLSAGNDISTLEVCGSHAAIDQNKCHTPLAKQKRGDSEPGVYSRRCLFCKRNAAFYARGISCPDHLWNIRGRNMRLPCIAFRICQPYSNNLNLSTPDLYARTVFWQMVDTYMRQRVKVSKTIIAQRNTRTIQIKH
jgi:hypothetical protein